MIGDNVQLYGHAERLNDLILNRTSVGFASQFIQEKMKNVAHEGTLSLCTEIWKLRIATLV